MKRNSRGKGANKNCVLKQVTNRSGELGRPCRKCPRVVPLRGEGLGHLPPIPHLLLVEAAPRGMSSPAFLACFPHRSIMFL